MGSKKRHPKKSKAGPFWHAHAVTAVFVMGDLDLAVRGRTYREPEGPHSLVVRGRDLDSALLHLASRTDCHALAVVGLPDTLPDMAALAGRRLLLVDGDSERLREYAEKAIRANIEVEWIRSARPPFERLASALLPVGAIVMVVVVYSSNDVRDAVDGSAELVHNAKAKTGMASSLQAGLRAMRDEIEAAVIVLGDQPLVGSRTIAALMRAWRREGSRPAVAVAQTHGEWAPPVVLARELWEELMALKGDAGARQILQGHPELLDMVPTPGRPDDIDTPEDYAKIVKLFPRRKPRQRA